jgi:hypothetical protein
VEQRLLLEGDDIDQLLERVRVEHGPHARIVHAQERLVGGFGGFFAKRRYEVAVAVDEPAPSAPSVLSTGSRPAASAGASAHRPSTPSGLEALLALADHADGSDHGASDLGASDLGASAHGAPKVDEALVRGPGRQVSTETTSFDDLVRDLVSRAADDVRREPRSAPVPVATPAAFVPTDFSATDFSVTDFSADDVVATDVGAAGLGATELGATLVSAQASLSAGRRATAATAGTSAAAAAASTASNGSSTPFPATTERPFSALPEQRWTPPIDDSQPSQPSQTSEPSRPRQPGEPPEVRPSAQREAESGGYVGRHGVRRARARGRVVPQLLIDLGLPVEPDDAAADPRVALLDLLDEIAVPAPDDLTGLHLVVGPRDQATRVALAWVRSVGLPDRAVVEADVTGAGSGVQVTDAVGAQLADCGAVVVVVDAGPGRADVRRTGRLIEVLGAQRVGSLTLAVDARWSPAVCAGWVDALELRAVRATAVAAYGLEHCARPLALLDLALPVHWLDGAAAALGAWAAVCLDAPRS